MTNSNLKNIVVLKNLPSNLIEEAIVILKTNKSAKQLQFIEKSSNSSYEEQRQENEYVIKEAESVISNYISKMEKNKVIKKNSNNIENKYNKIKIYSLAISIAFILCVLKIII